MITLTLLWVREEENVVPLKWGADVEDVEPTIVYKV
jgi:hypothetical protein